MRRLGYAAARQGTEGQLLEEIEFQQRLKAARLGERSGVVALYSGYNSMLLRYLRARAPGAGEDLAQETWLAAGPGLARFRGDERAFRVWLLSHARRQVLEHRAQSERLPTTLMTPQALNGVTWHDVVGEATVADAALAQLLAGLSEVHAEVLLLRIVGGLTAEETASLVGKNAGAVRVIQHRALKRLSARLSDERSRT